MHDQTKPTFIQKILRFSSGVLILIVLVVLALAYEAGRWSVYYSHPELSNSEQAGAVLSKVGALIQLPSNETPVIASIKDATAAKKTQPFLVNSEDGDVLIVYSIAAEAILYRPSTNKLIAVGPVNPGTGDQSAEQVPASPSSAVTPISISAPHATSTSTKR